MKSAHSILLLPLLLFLFSCTQNYKDRQLATKMAQETAQQFYQLEFNEKVQNHPSFEANYISAMMARTKIQLEDPVQSSSKKSVAVTIEKPPLSVRTALLAIIQKTDNWKDAKLNMADATILIYKELNLPSESLETEKFQIYLASDKD